MWGLGLREKYYYLSGGRRNEIVSHLHKLAQHFPIAD